MNYDDSLWFPLYGNIDQLIFFSIFHFKWILSYDVNGKEKINFRNETFNKNEMWMQKSLIKLVKFYGKNEILYEFLKSCNEILK